ncbi:MAG TPA: hypothetical protein VGP99_13495 [Tepidisphaeraceae bacterium]|jgi:hypothetical protein|nr:hypothetical protein [Tepidisphaeraceae bacterium]
MIRFFCPTCRAKIQAPDDNAGRTGRCPKCQGSFVVPAASAAELAESLSTFGNEIPAVPIPPSTRPASPFEVFGTGETPAQAPPPLPTTAQSAPTQAGTRRIVDREEWEEPEEESTQPPPPPLRPKASTGWLPLALAGAGALLILITIIVGVMGRKTSQSVAVDSRGNALPDKSKPKQGQIEIIPKSNALPTTLPTTEPAVAAPTRNPLVIAARASGAKQPVFDPAPKVANPTTRPVAAAKQLKTAQSLVTPVHVNDTVYFAAKNGSFYSIKTDSLELVEQPKLIEPVQRLVRDGTKLKAESLQPTPQTAIDFGSSIEAIDPENMDPSGTATKLNGKNLPLKFRQHLTGEKQVVLYRDKLWRPTSGGNIKVLEAGKVTEYTTEVVGIGLWKIALLPQGPLGYDNASVYALDEHLCPTKRLINVDPDVGRWSQSRINSFLASNEKTLCFVSAYNNKARMMIWSPHGSKKFREVPVTYSETATTEGNRLTLLGDGYLFCGGEITWLPITGGAPLRFGIQPATPAAQPSIRTQRRAATTPPTMTKVQNFTPPIITADKVFVGHASGGVYVFETSAFTGASAASDTATTSP